ncbi:MAG: ArsB/NhaD family transporter [Planctomycetota bacterium]
MAHAAAFSILALTVGLSLTRPRVGRRRITPPSAAVVGALLTLAVGLVALRGVYETLAFLAQPVLTIVSLMVITLIAEQAGFFRFLAWRVARAAKGDGQRLFRYLFLAGTLTGALFTNDAAVLIFTPMVFRLVEEVKEDSWGRANKVPYYFAVLYVANLVAPLVIGNPINIIVASWFGIGFLEYALWMTLPAVVSIVVTYAGLRFFFRKSIPATYRVPDRFEQGCESRRFMVVSGAVLLLTLLGFFSERVTGIPTSIVAALGAAALVVAYLAFARGSLAPVARGIGWDVIIFVTGIFLVARGLSNAGLTSAIGDFLQASSGTGGAIPTFSTGVIAGTCSAVMNNHPVAGIMAMVVRDMSLSDLGTRMMAFSALIGGDLGPKMLPIGSLAALMWFRILRSKGVEISYWQYIRLGVPVTLAAILLSILTLNLEFELFVWLH